VANRVALTAAGGVLALSAALLAKWEGVRYVPYYDSVGVLTVCYGHTGGIDPRKVYTATECQALLQHDMASANSTVRKCIGTPMLRQVEVALTSATFNIGPSVVCGSTLQRMAKANDWPGACAQLARWNKAGGREMRGLTLRRADEQALCEGRALWG